MNDIFKGITNALTKATFKVRKHSPEILVVTGIIGTVVSTVLACKATLKVDDVLEESKEKLDKIHNCADDPELAKDYSEADMNKDTTMVYVQTGIKLVKLYAPSVILGALSIGSIVTSNGILRKRNASLAAAYMVVDRSFKEYRSRVVDQFGEKVDRQLKYNLKAVEVEEKVVDENGETKTVKKTLEVADSDHPMQYSEYAKIFDETNPNWERDSEFNLNWLKAQQSYCNDLLMGRGYLFLNEVYDILGFPRTKAGQVVGWIYDPNDKTLDNYVDFGIYNIYNKKACEFVNGYESRIILDFNVEGDILHNNKCNLGKF